MTTNFYLKNIKEIIDLINYKKKLKPKNHIVFSEKQDFISKISKNA
jgi:hypothetical protein